MPSQNPDHGAHIALPAEVTRLTEAVDYFKAKGDEKLLSQLVPQLDGAKERLDHAAKAATFVTMLGLHDHEVTRDSYTFNDAVNVVAKVLHEHEHHTTGRYTVPNLHTRAHQHLKGANDGAHCDEALLGAERDPGAEVIEHLGLTDPAHMAAAHALFQKVKV